MTATEKLRDAGERLFAQIVKWHEDDRRVTIRRTFALGDLIVNATIASGLSEYEVINRIISMMGDLAMGVTSYNRAARMARVFTKNQRAVLIDKMLSLEKCEILAGEFYDGKKRINVIANIKSGKTKAPWPEIKGAKETCRDRSVSLSFRKRPRDTSLVDSGRNPDNIVIQIVRHGEIDEDAVIKVMKNLISRTGLEKAFQLWEIAKREVGAR